MNSIFKLRAVRLAVVSALAMGGAGFAVSAFAATQTADLPVTATVANNCTISTAAVAFGAYNTTSPTDKDAAGTVSVYCTIGASTAVTLGQGANAGGASTDAVPVRRMISGSDLLGYELYSDTGRTSVWENVTGVAHTGTGTVTALSVYGRIPAQQNVPVGSYADTVVATITF